MPRNGSGVYTPPSPEYPAVAGTLIVAATRNTLDADIATALTQSVAANGETPITANIPMAGFKLTGLGNGTSRTDAANVGQLVEQKGIYVATVGGTVDVITLTPAPSIGAYAAGQRFSFIAAGANTGAVTVNVSSVGAKNLQKRGSNALVAGDIPSGALVTMEYDGTRFQLLAPATGAQAADSATISGAWTFTSGFALSSAQPTLRWIETDAAAHGQLWRMRANGGVLILESANDDASNLRDIMRVTRTAGSAAITDIVFGESGNEPDIAINAAELDIRGTSFHSSSWVRSGTYTPTATNVANCNTLTPSVAMYIRMGNVVQEAGQITVVPTTGAGTLTRFRLSLAISSNLTAASELSGMAVDDTLGATGIAPVWQIFGDATNNEAEFRNEGVAAGSRIVRYQFMYQVL